MTNESKTPLISDHQQQQQSQYQQTPLIYNQPPPQYQPQYQQTPPQYPPQQQQQQSQFQYQYGQVPQPIYVAPGVIQPIYIDHHHLRAIDPHYTQMMIILLIGVFFPFVWAGGFFYLKSKNKPVRTMALISISLFFISLVAIVVIVAIVVRVAVEQSRYD